MKQPPQAAADAIKRLSPLNLYGKPRYRLIWSEDPKTWVCGWFNVFDESGNLTGVRFEREEINKYPFSPASWIVEIWEPPEFFGSPERWQQQTQGTEKGAWYHEIGPYPHEGDYRFLWQCTNKRTKEPVEPTERIIEDFFRRLHLPTEADLSAERIAKAEKERKQRLKNITEAIGDEAFGGRHNNLNPKDLLRKIREDRILKEASR